MEDCAGPKSISRTVARCGDERRDFWRRDGRGSAASEAEPLLVAVSSRGRTTEDPSGAEGTGMKLLRPRVAEARDARELANDPQRHSGAPIRPRIPAPRIALVPTTL